MVLAATIAYGVNLADITMPAPPGKTEGYPLYIYVSIPHYLVSSLVLIGIAAIAALISSYSIAKVNMTEALS